MSLIADLTLVKVPRRLAEVFGSDEMPRWALEAILVEAVRKGRCSRGFMRESLGMGFTVAEELLASHGVLYDYTIEEIEHDAGIAAVHV